MSIQVSSSPNNTGLSPAVKNRDAYLTHLVALGQQMQPRLNWLHELRNDAASQVREQPFPTTRSEEWRFTDLSPLLQISFGGNSGQQPAVSLLEIEALILPEAAQSRLVFVNGAYAPELSAVANLPNGLKVGPLLELEEFSDRLQPYLSQQAGAAEIFTALNTAGLTDAAVVWASRNRAIATPIHLLFISTAQTATFVQPRCLVIAEPNSSLTIVEDYVTLGEETHFTNSVTEIWVEENAQVNHTRVQREGKSFHIGKTAVSQARNSRYTCNAVSLGASLSRHNLEIYQTGEQTETTLNGLTAIGEDQLADTHSAIALTKPYGTTRQLHKCIIDDRAHAVFNGKVFVPKAAQLTDAGQLNRNLLLSPKARVDTKPQLEIVADNVKCSHGATVGQLDTDEVFYLQSRGIDAASARNLLIYSFAFEIIDRIPLPSLQQTLSQQVATQQTPYTTPPQEPLTPNPQS